MLTDPKILGDGAYFFFDLHMIHGCLNGNSEYSMSVEEFAKNFADLKRFIYDKIHTASFQYR